MDCIEVGNWYYNKVVKIEHELSKEEMNKIRKDFENDVIESCKLENESAKMILSQAFSNIENIKYYDNSFKYFLPRVAGEFKCLENLINFVIIREMAANKI